MGDKIRTAIEIAMEKAEKLSGLSEEEKDEIKINKKIGPILSKFFKGSLDAEGLWKKLKDEKKPALKQAQKKIIESMTVSLSQDEIGRRKNAVLALEHLKKNSDAAFAEALLDSIEELGINARQEKESFYNGLKSQLENNPQLLVRQVNSGGKKMMVRLSVEQAISQSKEWRDFLADHERRFSQDFSENLARIKEELGI